MEQWQPMTLIKIHCLFLTSHFPDSRFTHDFATSPRTTHTHQHTHTHSVFPHTHLPNKLQLAAAAAAAGLLLSRYACLCNSVPRICHLLNPFGDFLALILTGSMRNKLHLVSCPSLFPPPPTAGLSVCLSVCLSSVFGLSVFRLCFVCLF